MNAEIIASIVSGTAVLIGAVFGLFTIKLKADAQRRFLVLLSSDERAQHLRKLRSEVMHDGVTTAKELQQLIDSLDCLSQNLSDAHRRAIAEGLHQHSMRGRARYVAKLMNKAGIGSGPLLVATE